MKSKSKINYQRAYIYLNIVIILMSVLMLGLLMNFVAITKNSGKMPVLADYDYQDDMHFTYQNNSQVNYPQFSDRFYFANYIFSIGDAFMVIGTLLLFVIYTLMHFSRWRIKTKVKYESPAKS